MVTTSGVRIDVKLNEGMKYMYTEQRLHTHEARGELGVRADLAVHLDKLLGADLNHLPLCQRVFQSVPENDHQREGLATLQVHATRGINHEKYSTGFDTNNAPCGGLRRPWGPRCRPTCPTSSA